MPVCAHRRQDRQVRNLSLSRRHRLSGQRPCQQGSTLRDRDAATTFVDPEPLPRGGRFVYFVVAEFDDRRRSGPSNFATITLDD